MARHFRRAQRTSHPHADRLRPARRSLAKTRYKLATTSDLQPGESKKFLLPIEGSDEECFIINYKGQFHAYVNRCRHVPMAMDWVDNQFFTEQGEYLMCQTHNAYYQPDSGECIAGPTGTCGKFLYRVPLEIIDDVIYARAPEQKFEED